MDVCKINMHLLEKFDNWSVSHSFMASQEGSAGLPCVSLHPLQAKLSALVAKLVTPR